MFGDFDILKTRPLLGKMHLQECFLNEVYICCL